MAAALYHGYGGKVTRLVLYWNRERAHAGLGLAGGRLSGLVDRSWGGGGLAA